MKMETGVPYLSCTLNTPEALEGDTIHALPPYANVRAYPVDKYPRCPSSWMHGSIKSGSYFLAVEPGKGMWLDFNGCGQHSHHVAIVVSIQGVNPVTGQKTDAMRLEQYKENCPLHSLPFKSGRFCETCGFEWPAQNYLCTTGTPFGQLWLDGFRTPDGKVRQYIFTEEMARGVAAQVIGSDRVFAVGVAFFVSKETKPQTHMYTGVTWQNLSYYCGASPPKGVEISTMYCSMPKDHEEYTSGGTFYSADSVDLTSSSLVMQERSITRGLKKIEVGAGASIRQEIHSDPEEIEFWQDEPAAMLYVNYCDPESLQRILETPRSEKTEGFLDSLKIGN